MWLFLLLQNVQIQLKCMLVFIYPNFIYSSKIEFSKLLRFGDVDLSDSIDDQYLQIYRINQTIINSTLGIALWKPERNVYINEYVNPICLPLLFDEDQEKYLGEHVTLTSFGKSSREPHDGILTQMPAVVQPKRYFLNILH